MGAVILGPEEEKCTKWRIIVFTKFERTDSFATNLNAPFTPTKNVSLDQIFKSEKQERKTETRVFAKDSNEIQHVAAFMEEKNLNLV